MIGENSQVVHLRATSASFSRTMLSGIHHSLATLRGWMILDLLPQKMFSDREGKDWNRANYLLATQAAPTAAMIVETLDAMVINQKGSCLPIWLRSFNPSLKVAQIINLMGCEGNEQLVVDKNTLLLN